jgi:RNA polymerase sigma factor (sigma-70 family)
MPEARTTITTDSLQDRFEALFDQHRKIVFKVANTYCRHAEDRRDLAQEISVQLWRAFPGYDPQRPFSTWMYRVALNVAISFARRAGQRRKHMVALDDSTAEPIDDRAATRETDDRVHALYRIIDGLADLDRALMLLYLEDHGYREIAEVLGISETNVATKINRLKQRIRQGVLLQQTA